MTNLPRVTYSNTGEDFSGVTHVVEKRFGRKVSEAP